MQTSKWEKLNVFPSRNDTCKLYFEAIMEADIWVNLQVIPVPYGIKHATYCEKLHPNFEFFDSFFFVFSKVEDNLVRIAYLLELTVHEK